MDAKKLLPNLGQSGRYFAYAGSLTTPDCRQGVLWLVSEEHGAVSGSDVTAMGKIVAKFPDYSGYDKNNRPVQRRDVPGVLLFGVKKPKP